MIWKYCFLFLRKTDFFTPLDRIFSRSTKAFTICANTRGIAKLSALLFLFLYLSLCRILFLPRSSRTRLYRRSITAQYSLEKLSSFRQANSESNATPYNSIRRRRKKCRGKEGAGKGMEHQNGERQEEEYLVQLSIRGGCFISLISVFS